MVSQFSILLIFWCWNAISQKNIYGFSNPHQIVKCLLFFKTWPNDPVKGLEKTATLNRKILEDSIGLYCHSCQTTRYICQLYWDIFWSNHDGYHNLTTSSRDVRCYQFNVFVATAHCLLASVCICRWSYSWRHPEWQHYQVLLVISWAATN